MARMNRRDWLAQGLVAGGSMAMGLPNAARGPGRSGPSSENRRCFGIRVIDDQTGRGVPLVELRTVNNIRYYTDSAGYAAVEGPGLLNQPTFFFVSGPGYEYPKDGFGYVGVTLDVKPGASATIKVKRINIAERLYRITGEGIYRDSVILGHRPPILQPLLDGKVLGQDSVQAVVYQGRIHWIWGDTLQPAYPLGNFRSSGAVSDLPADGGLDPGEGVNLTYFTDRKSGFCRAICPLPREPGGTVWMDGLAVIPGKAGGELMVARYGHYAGLTKLLDQGLALWDDQSRVFRKYAGYSRTEQWRMPTGHPAAYVDGGVEYRLIRPRGRGSFPTVRVRADLAALADSSSYEAFTCLRPGEPYRGDQSKIDRAPGGKIVWGWKLHTDPLNTARERILLEAGLIKPNEAHFQIKQDPTDESLNTAGSSFFWNPWLQKWIMIAVQLSGNSFPDDLIELAELAIADVPLSLRPAGSPSVLGEIWFSAADAATGPWTRARKIATHPDYSFYNPTQHPFFDQHGGRIIYFEGTYSVFFSGNSHPTPRYDYNQIMYRLDLSDPRLKGL